MPTKTHGVKLKNNIREYRERIGMSGYRLAKELGYAGNGYVHRLENGTTIPGVDLAYRIAAILNTTIDKLYVPTKKL